jgi:hypothetical protein
MRRLALVAVLVGALGVVAVARREATAQVTGIEAKYHGVLSIRRATGSIDRDTGSGTIKVRRWIALATPDTNGIFPDQEAALITVGLNEDSFPLAAGSLKKSRSGRVFSYRARKSDPGRLRSFRFWLQKDGSYGIRFALSGVELSRLRREDPICVPIAVIIGDDDFFNGISLTSPSFTSKKVVVPSSCEVSTDDWPWVR